MGCSRYQSQRSMVLKHINKGKLTTSSTLLLNGGKVDRLIAYFQLLLFSSAARSNLIGGLTLF
jgi:hypothetical protein